MRGPDVSDQDDGEGLGDDVEAEDKEVTMEDLFNVGEDPIVENPMMSVDLPSFDVPNPNSLVFESAPTKIVESDHNVIGSIPNVIGFASNSVDMGMGES